MASELGTTPTPRRNTLLSSTSCTAIQGGSCVRPQSYQSTGQAYGPGPLSTRRPGLQQQQTTVGYSDSHSYYISAPVAGPSSNVDSSNSYEKRMVHVKIALVLFFGLLHCTNAQESQPWYVEPLWYSRIEAEDETGLLSRCLEWHNSRPPKHGALCTSEPAVCYFGTQDCDGVGAHPEIMCVCDGQQQDGTMGRWQCDEERMACPLFPDPTRTGCAAPGEEIDHGNAAVCLEEDQGNFNLGNLQGCEFVEGTCGEPGTICYYGSVSWYVSYGCCLMLDCCAYW